MLTKPRGWANVLHGKLGILEESNVTFFGCLGNGWPSRFPLSSWPKNDEGPFVGPSFFNEGLYDCCLGFPSYFSTRPDLMQVVQTRFVTRLPFSKTWTFCRLGSCLILLLLCAWETQLPDSGPLPQISHRFAMFRSPCRGRFPGSHPGTPTRKEDRGSISRPENQPFYDSNPFFSWVTKGFFSTSVFLPADRLSAVPFWRRLQLRDLELSLGRKTRYFCKVFGKAGRRNPGLSRACIQRWA
jgi:hypothetical protein